VNDCLASAARSLDRFATTAQVHIPRFAAHKCFIRFDFAGEFVERSNVHGVANSVQHVPSAFLRYLDGAGKFATADAILGIRNAPDRDEPFVQAEWTIFKDRPDFDRKLFSTVLRFALHHVTAGDVPDVGRAALWATDDAIRPLDLDHVGMANVQIGVVADGL
jgi:hypothetical protein